MINTYSFHPAVTEYYMEYIVMAYTLYKLDNQTKDSFHPFAT